MKKNKTNKYWEERKELKYYKRVVDLSKKYFETAGSVIDIGSCDSEVLSYLDWIPDRTAIDLRKLPELKNVEKIKADFMKFKFKKNYDAAICLQVLEHVKNPEKFVKKIFSISNITLLSLPYNWNDENKPISHIHHLIDEKKIYSWTKKEPSYFEIVSEDTGEKRIILVYNNYDNKIPIFPKKLNGTFWGITTFFNPAGYKNKYKNYKFFRKKSRRQGLNLLAVELAFGDRPFELKKRDADILVQIRGDENNIMWQKERLLNIGLKKLPENCDKIVWADCDLVFKNDDWIKQTASLLEKYVVVQPFSYVVRLKTGLKCIDSSHLKHLHRGNFEMQKMPGMGFSLANGGKEKIYEGFQNHGDCGFVWAIRKEAIIKDEFYDKNILGSGDKFMAYSFYLYENEFLNKLKFNCSTLDISRTVVDDYYSWAKKIFLNTRGSVFYTKGILFHLWHGEMKNRRYEWRYSMLNKYNFDLKKDIKIDDRGLWIWSSDKKMMHNEMKDYFMSRNEQGNFKLGVRGFFRDMTFKRSIVAYHRFMGKVGILIINNYPDSYKFLKRIKDKAELYLFRINRH